MSSTKSKTWTEPRAWLYLAQQWDRAKLNARGSACTQFRGVACLCLCASLIELDNHGLISEAMRRTMCACATPRHGGLRWATTIHGARQRAAFCRKMAKECS